MWVWRRVAAPVEAGNRTILAIGAAAGRQRQGQSRYRSSCNVCKSTNSALFTNRQSQSMPLNTLIMCPARKAYGRALTVSEGFNPWPDIASAKVDQWIPAQTPRLGQDSSAPTVFSTHQLPSCLSAQQSPEGSELREHAAICRVFAVNRAAGGSAAASDRGTCAASRGHGKRLGSRKADSRCISRIGNSAEHHGHGMQPLPGRSINPVRSQAHSRRRYFDAAVTECELRAPHGGCTTYCPRIRRANRSFSVLRRPVATASA